MLAYLFWHTRGRGADAETYERALATFHQALVDSPPPGFLGCAAHRLDGCTWQAGPAYADWYLVEDWPALGVLNQAAVDARRRGTHDRVAASAAGGAGGIYQLRAGSHCIDARVAELWLDTPGPGEAQATWQRQMVLGPAPEFCLVGASAPAAATVVQRDVVFAGGLAI
jgi:hypothetical protein